MPIDIENEHPAVGLKSDFPKSEAERKNLFDRYKKFIKTEGLDEKTAEQFQVFLDRFFYQTGFSWIPGVCPLIPPLASIAKDISQKSFEDRVSIMPKTFHQVHFWLEIVRDGKENLIVDPTGATYHGQTLPYFGPARNVKDGLKEIYLEGATYEGVDSADK